MYIKLKLTAMMLLATSCQVAATDYPFTLPDNLSAEINIITQEQEKYNNQLLGTNIFNFNTNTDKDLIKKFDPLTIRFPHGLWANWYDWHTDSTRLFGGETVSFTNSEGQSFNRKIDHLDTIRIFEAGDSKIGIDGLTQLNNERKTNTGHNYDMVWTFNMSADGENGSVPADGSAESVARYLDILSRGFDVTNIEMGNENFYPGQRSSIIPNVSDYIDRAKSMSMALKAINPNIKLSIPLLRKPNTANPKYNELLTEDKSYFDAVTVHTYVGSDPDTAEDSNESWEAALLARNAIAASVDNYSKVVAPNKPIWLTEWGVKSGGPNAASILGMADTYIFMSENQTTYERANWFSVNGKLNSFLVWYDKEVQPGVFRPRIKYPLEKTAFGSAHEIIRSVFQDSVLLKTTNNSIAISDGVKAISARAVIKDNQVVLFVLNMTDKPSDFSVKLDNVVYTGIVTHHTMAFDNLAQEQVLPIDTDPLTLKPTTSSVITLPKLSLNRIVLNEQTITPKIFDVSVKTETNLYNHQVGDKVKLIAQAQSNDAVIQSVTFSENNTILSTDNTAPYELDWTTSTAGTRQITAVAKRADGSEKSSTILVNVEGEGEGEVLFDVSLLPPTKTTLVLGETLPLSATATTNKGEISSADFRVNNTSIKQLTTSPYQANWIPTATGTYTIDVLATKSDGSTQASSQVTITVTAALFDVSLTPLTTTSLELGETLPLSATASTNFGNITTVDFRVNGTSIKQVTSSPYQANWTPTAAGTYTIDVLATKSDGSTQASTQTTLTVNNVVTPPAKPSPTTDSSSGGGGSLSLFWLLTLGIITAGRKMVTSKYQE